jgi:hypothetical protein
MTINEEPEAVTLAGWVRNSSGLRPVAKRWPWIVGGLVIQAAGVAIVLAWAYGKYKDDAVTGAALRTTVKLIWMDTLHSHRGVAVLVGSAALFALGSVLLARPYVRSVPMLVVGIPLAALVGLAVLGAFALIIAVIALLAYAGFDGSGSGTGSRRNSASALSSGSTTKQRPEAEEAR